MFLLNKFYEVLSDFRFIFSKQYRKPKKFSLFLAYLSLRLKSYFGRIFNIKYQKACFLDYCVYFPDYYDFAMMFREIFIRRAYYFEAKTPNPNIIDCGGNIGMATLFFKHLYPEAEITVFEPSPEIFEFLKKNIEQNNLKNIKLVQAALYKKTGSISFFSSVKRKDGGGSTIIKENILSERKEESVPSVVLSKYITKPVDFLKIDTEGSESIIINEIKTAKKLNFIRECVLEYHYNNESTENPLERLLNIFHSNDFQIIIFDDDIDKPAFSLRKSKPYHFMIRAYK